MNQGPDLFFSEEDGSASRTENTPTAAQPPIPFGHSLLRREPLGGRSERGGFLRRGRRRELLQ